MRIFVRVKQHSNTIMAKLVSADLINGATCILEYTTTDRTMLSFDLNAFDAKIISHSYTDIGVIIFEKPITRIGDNAFKSYDKLTRITIPSSVTLIGNNAFYDCCNLIRATIPDSVTSIGELAFNGCIRLTNITIPKSVTSIGSSAFSECI